MAERFRDLVRPALIDVGARSTRTGGAEASLALAESLSSFSRTVTDVGLRLQTQRGAQEGAEAGAAGEPEFKRGLRSLSAYGAAYNSAAEVGYSAKLQTDVDESIARIERESVGDIEGYQSRVAGYSEGLLAEVPERLRPRISLAIESRRSAGEQRIHAQVIAENSNEALASYLEGAPALINSAITASSNLPEAEATEAFDAALAENNAMLDALVNGHVITATKRVELKSKFEEALQTGISDAFVSETVSGLMALARANVLEGDRALSALESDDTISEEEKSAIRTAYRTQRELLTFERSRQHVSESADLAGSLTAGLHGGDIVATNDELYRRGAISVDEYESNTSKIVRNVLKETQDDIDIEAIRSALEGGPGLDPTNTKQREALDKMFVQGTEVAGMEKGGNRWQTTALDVAEKTNVLPDSAESWMRVSLLSGDPEQTAVAASFAARVRETNPVAWSYNRDARLSAFSKQVEESISIGVEPERAIDIANKNVYGLSDAERDKLDERYREQKIDNDSVLKSQLDGDDEFDVTFFGGAPLAPLAMQAEYDEAVFDFFRYTNGDVEAAQKLAWEAVKSRYGRSTMNGEAEIVKYAPSKMYPGMADSIIRQDIVDTVKTVGYEGDPGDVRVVPIPMTEDTQGLVWGLQVLDEFGAFDVLRDDRNAPVTYLLPVGQAYDDAKSAIEARMLAEAAAEVERKQEETKRRKADVLSRRAAF